MTAAFRLRLGAALCLGVSLLLTPIPLQGQTPRITIEVDTAVVTVGDRITLLVSVDHPSESQVIWPDSLNLDPFEVLQARVLPPIPLEDGVRSSASLTLSAFELGDLEIPSFEVEVLDGEGGSATLATDRFGIQVTTVGLDEGGDIREIRGPLAIPVGLGRAFLIALALLLATGLAWAILRRMKRRDSPAQAPGPHLPPRPPHEVALEALARLEASPLLERGEVKEYHIQASEILRTYVEDRFRVPALEMTTVDLVGDMARRGAEPWVVEGLRDFLQPCDMVKFAKSRPEEEASRSLLGLGRRLVEETMWVPPPVPVASPPASAVSPPAPATSPSAPAASPPAPAASPPAPAASPPAPAASPPAPAASPPLREGDGNLEEEV